MSITAMKQALEALEGYEGRRAKAILRQAIEQAEKVEPVAIFDVAVNNEIAAVWYDCANGTLKNGDKLYNTTPPTAPAQQAVPQGWKLVPVEPTMEMYAVGDAIWVDAARVYDCTGTGSIYKAMLSAAPTAPAQQAVPSIEQAEKQEPVAYECPKGCGCWWRDNRDGTMSLFNGDQKSCSICECLPLSGLSPVSIADHLFIERRDGDNWLVCVERVFKGGAEAKKACQKWKGYTRPPTAQGLFVDMITKHEGLAEELAASAQQLTQDQGDQMLKLCPYWGPSPGRDAWIAGYEAAHGIKGASPAQPAVPQGWKLVPMEPTEEMTEAAVADYYMDARPVKRKVANSIYRDMLSASSTAAAQQPLTDEQIAEWAARHDVNGSVTDLRCTAEDVRSIKGASL